MPVRLKGLETALRKYRTEQAYVRAVPAMNVFGDKVLRSIVSSKPTTLKLLGEIKGIGARRREMYGRDIVRLVNLSGLARRATGARRPAGKPRPIPKVSRFFGGGLPAAGRRSRSGSVPKAEPISLPKPEPKPEPGPDPRLTPTRRARRADPPTSVYILELEQGRVYVGSSRDVRRRVEQHVSGKGSAYTRVYKPTGVLLPRLGNVGGDGDAAERDETLRYMMLRGIPYVRGWKFAQVVMGPAEYDEAEANIRELFNLCRRCGYQGHFITHCKANFDRHGTDLRK